MFSEQHWLQLCCTSTSSCSLACVVIGCNTHTLCVCGLGAAETCRWLRAVKHPLADMCSGWLLLSKKRAVGLRQLHTTTQQQTQATLLSLQPNLQHSPGDTASHRPQPCAASNNALDCQGLQHMPPYCPAAAPWVCDCTLEQHGLGGSVNQEKQEGAVEGLQDSTQQGKGSDTS